MADNSKIVFSGGAGAAIGVALGMLFGGPNVSGIEAQVGTTGTEVSALSGQLGALTERLTALEAAATAEPETPAVSADDLTAAVTGATSAVETALGGRIDALETAISSGNEAQVDAIVAAMDARYEERMREYREQMEARREAMRERHGNREAGDKPHRPRGNPDMESDNTSSDAAEQATTDESPAAPAHDLAVAQTQVLADGKVTAYVAGFLNDGEVVRVALNGFAISELRANRGAEVIVGEETCSVTFLGITDGAAAFEAACE